MTPSQTSFAVGALSLAAFLLLNLLVLRLPGRTAPVTRQALLGLAVHGLATLLAAWQIPAITYWHGAALYWLGFNVALFGFSAVYKSVSLRILTELAARPDGTLPLADVVQAHVRPCFTTRTALLLEAGLTREEAGRFTLTAGGHKAAARCGRVQRCFGIERSGLYSDAA
jgi:hypothetical protein